MRQIICDVETTGLNPHATKNPDRIVEIACVELMNGHRTGRIFHSYLHPQRDVPLVAQNVHGLSAEFLADKPLFKDIVPTLVDFIDGAELIAHNAPFDRNFINAELVRAGTDPIPNDLWMDTLELFRHKHPKSSGQTQHKLDHLCTLYGVDTSKRSTHGALIDAELLAEVYPLLADPSYIPTPATKITHVESERMRPQPPKLRTARG
ncbi:MAG: DNA polymerase III subunit epsilon [Alphaproteobacteria bacterium]|nr:MAG: DNA polymerase III subunit epsilon [Alphaproteobacteria bacterium]TAF14179.1 MAG: DNA polymerase III subunit epsilon [Alphaproteobacteria bacterium]TAF39162.1 MAG: DNA polymerase III subunit epsilon [Alphaproteobacteria bacterium]TAF74955.1 MAG: DNA polymerase III subunit epsilon [Alphaproteobacteria bacterium]